MTLKYSEFNQEIDLNHEKITKIYGFERFKNLKNLCLRQNLLKKIENLGPLSESLLELDLYDNLLTEIENLQCLTNLTYWLSKIAI